MIRPLVRTAVINSRQNHHLLAEFHAPNLGKQTTGGGPVSPGFGARVMQVQYGSVTASATSLQLATKSGGTQMP